MQDQLSRDHGQAISQYERYIKHVVTNTWSGCVLDRAVGKKLKSLGLLGTGIKFAEICLILPHSGIRKGKIGMRLNEAICIHFTSFGQPKKAKLG